MVQRLFDFILKPERAIEKKGRVNFDELDNALVTPILIIPFQEVKTESDMHHMENRDKKDRA